MKKPLTLILSAFLLAACSSQSSTSEASSSTPVSLEQPSSSVVSSSVAPASSEAPSSSVIESSDSSEESSDDSSGEISSIDSSEESSDESSEELSSVDSSEESSSESSSEEYSASEESSSSALSSSVESSSASISESVSSYYSSLSSQEADPKWNVNFNEYGKNFMVTLSKLTKATGGVATYKSCLSIGAKAAAWPNENSSTFIPFYHDHKDSETTTQDKCNREHTWPNSRGGGMFDNDPIMVRPTLSSDNSSRGNNFYGVTSGNQWDPASCHYEGARGESARIILYCAVTYYSEGISLTNTPNDATSDHTMGTLKTLLKWNREYQPSAFEKTVNDRYDSMGYRRNPFVDHPEYAEYIWDDDGVRISAPDDSSFPSYSGGSSSSSKEVVRYEQATDYERLDGNSYLVSTTVGNSTYTMTEMAKSATLPWYIVGDPATIEDGKLSSECDLVWFRFDEVERGTFTITAPSGKQLYGYVAGTHYSIGIANSTQEIEAAQSGTTIANITNKWKIEETNNVLQLTTGSVYLEYYNGSWCGYKQAPQNASIMLFA